MTDEQLSALLRLKRFEQPPEGYFDGLLRDIHRRQREELLRRPLWKIAVERMQTFFGEHSMSSSAYAGAMASVVAAGIVTIAVVTPRAQSHSPAGAVAGTGTDMSRSPAATEPSVRLEQQRPEMLDFQGQSSFRRTALNSPRLDFRVQPSSRTALNSPRYVIDARPVSYDASSLSSF
jgi:hypothetical protein